MFLALRLLPIISTIILTISFSLISWSPKNLNPETWYTKVLLFASIMAILVPLITIYLLLARSYNELIKNNKLKYFLSYLIIPFLFSISTLLYILFINKTLYIFFAIIVFAIFFFIYIEDLFIYLYYPPRYHLGSLENLSQYISIIIVFFIFSTIFGLIIFVSIPLWILGIVATIVISLLIYHMTFINKFQANETIPIIIISTLIIIELISVISLLSSSIYVNSLLISLSFYLISGINQAYLLKKLTKNVIILYSSIMMILLLIVLLTARWT